ncbi:MAG: M48 family metallopeptidase [Dehalococcoidales bacterium]|nr:M48 family metallopeptidase [Dehalococcoidales bacterium]
MKLSQKIEDEELLPGFTLIRMRRKTLYIRIKDDLSIEVKVPTRTPNSEVNAFVMRHDKWIKKHTERLKNRPHIKLSDDDIGRLKKEAKAYLTEKTRYYSEIMRLYPTSIKITEARTRFGSCSPKNSICYSYRLMLYPEAAREYVVVHELAHIKHKNHGKDFYRTIEHVLPDYKERKELLKK